MFESAKNVLLRVEENGYLPEDYAIWSLISVGQFAIAIRPCNTMATGW